MPVKSDEPEPFEFLEQLVRDVIEHKVSGFAIVVDYDVEGRAEKYETFRGVLAEDKRRLVGLIPGLEALLAEAREQQRRMQ